MDQLSQTRLAEITAKSPADLTEADAAFLLARRSYLNDEQRAVFADVLAEVEDKPKGPYAGLALKKLKALAKEREIDLADDASAEAIVEALTAADAAQ